MILVLSTGIAKRLIKEAQARLNLLFWIKVKTKKPKTQTF